MEEEDRKAALFLQAQLEKEAQEDSKYRQQLEQERRDHELALRLAQESNGQIDESPTMSRKYVKIIFIRFNNFSYFGEICQSFPKMYKIGLDSVFRVILYFCCVKYVLKLKENLILSNSGTPDIVLGNHNRLIRFVDTTFSFC